MTNRTAKNRKLKKLSKYFSLFKFTITNPKNGISMLNDARQAEKDSKQTIQKHSANSLNLEKCLEFCFPGSNFSKETLIQNTKDLELHFKNYFKKLGSEKFPSKKKPYPVDYSIRNDSRLFLYGLCKIMKPDVVVETGVAYGQSSSYILQALKENNNGILYSIDNIFRPWESLEMIGSAIPHNLRKKWKLVVGSSVVKLEETLRSKKTIDMFLHDSLHTYKNMLFEYNITWPFIKKNGFLISDDILENNAFLDFYSTVNGSPILMADNQNQEIFLGIIRKK